jgi:hypothetical protein
MAELADADRHHQVTLSQIEAGKKDLAAREAGMSEREAAVAAREHAAHVAGQV